MKKQLNFILVLFLLINCFYQPALAIQESIQLTNATKTRTYCVADPNLVMKSVLKVIKAEGLDIIYKNDDFMYVSASKHSPIKDISIPLLAFYALRMGWDAVQTILTSGLKGYTLVCDIMVIRIEFKDKDIETLMGINIKNKGDKTDVAINTTIYMTGKRDGLPIGKNNRLKTTQIKDDGEYDLFFDKLNKELKANTKDL